MDLTQLTQCPLFQGMTPAEVEQAVALLNPRTRVYQRGETIFHAQQTTPSLGVVLSGGVHIEHHDAWGSKNIFAYVAPGEIFGETYACLPNQPLLVSAVAAEASSILFLQVSQLLTPSAPPHPAQNRLLAQLLRLFAQKNLGLSRRILHTSPKTIRGRLLSYLSEQAIVHGGPRFTIPFNRQELADFLSVDRSALSNELSKMRQEGLLDYYRSSFLLKQPIEEDFAEP